MANSAFLKMMNNMYDLYDNGKEYVSIIQGITNSSVLPNYIENSSDIEIISQYTLELYAVNTTVTQSSIDLSKYNSCCVWFQYQNTFDIYSNSLTIDISSLSSNYYIRVHNYTGTERGGDFSTVYLIASTSRDSDETVYNIRSFYNSPLLFDFGTMFIKKISLY